VSVPPLSWAPSAEASKRILFYVAYLLLIIGATAFGLSFDAVMVACRPVFGAASWAAPLLLDTTLAALTAAGLVLELNGLRARLPQWFARVLIGLTIYANVEPARGLFARILHGAPPTVWAVLVIIAEQTVRRLVGLSADNRLEGIRRSLWVLRPAATWRLWRQMRIHQVTTYREALDRDAARAAVVGRMRLHYGRFWRTNAPLAERIALRLEGRDPDGIAAILTAHQTTTALLSGTYLQPAPEPFPEADPEPAEAAPEGGEQQPPKPYRRRTASRGKKPSRTPSLRRTEAQLLAEASALNAQVIAQTGAPVSVRRIRSEVRVGQPTAERLRAALLAAEHTIPEPVPDSVPEYAEVLPIRRVNGAGLESSEEIAARL